MSNRIVATVDPVSGRVEALTEGGMSLPLDSDGLEAPSPIEGLLASLAGCTAVDVASILRKKRQSATEYEVAVDGDRTDEHPRVFTAIRVEHRYRLIDEAGDEHEAVVTVLGPGGRRLPD